MWLLIISDLIKSHRLALHHLASLAHLPQAMPTNLTHKIKVQRPNLTNWCWVGPTYPTLNMHRLFDRNVLWEINITHNQTHPEKYVNTIQPTKYFSRNQHHQSFCKGSIFIKEDISAEVEKWICQEGEKVNSKHCLSLFPILNQNTQHNTPQKTIFFKMNEFQEQ